MVMLCNAANDALHFLGKLLPSFSFLLIDVCYLLSGLQSHVSAYVPSSNYHYWSFHSLKQMMCFRCLIQSLLSVTLLKVMMQALEHKLALLGLTIIVKPSFISAGAYTFNLNCSLIILIVKHFLMVSSMKKHCPYSP